MKLILAPMEGLTDPIMRDTLTSVGDFDWCVTEFIRVTDSILPDHIYYNFCPELKNDGKTAAGTPVHVQFLGNNPDMLAVNAAKVVELGAPAIDLNFGCPAKTVNSHDGGASLLKKPSRLYDVVSAVRKAVPSDFSVSAKVRLGFDNKDYVTDIAQACDAAGASWLTVHARTVAQMYRPGVRYDLIAQAAKEMCCPVLLNGNVHGAAQAKQLLAETKVRGLMIGRGAIRNPWIFEQIRAVQRAAGVPPAGQTQDGSSGKMPEEHLPAGRDVLAYIRELIGGYRHQILMGDMNTHANDLIDHSPLRDLGLIAPQVEATFPSWRPQRCLDHILLSPSLTLERVEVLAQPISDHLPVAVEIRLPDALTVDTLPVLS